MLTQKKVTRDTKKSENYLSDSCNHIYMNLHFTVQYPGVRTTLRTHVLRVPGYTPYSSIYDLCIFRFSISKCSNSRVHQTLQSQHFATQALSVCCVGIVQIIQWCTTIR